MKKNEKAKIRAMVRTAKWMLNEIENNNRLFAINDEYEYSIEVEKIELDYNNVISVEFSSAKKNPHMDYEFSPAVLLMMHDGECKIKKFLHEDTDIYLEAARGFLGEIKCQS